jgi:FtsH-binding integral membrane protein
VEGPVVLIAVAITLIITIAITLYAFFVKANYLVLFGIIIVVSVTAILVLIIALISMAPVMISIYCGLAVIIYGIYLVVVTKMVIGGDNEMVAFPLDNYIIASLILYLYIMRMFLMILRIVANSRR